MSASFRISVLSGKSVAQAFPLIQATWPTADMGTWQSYVEFFNERTGGEDGGIVALHDTAGYICGVLAYRLDRDLHAGPFLSVHLFTAVDLLSSLRTVRALLDVAEARARALGCTGMQIRLHKEQTRLAARLRGLGLSSDHRLFWTDIDVASPPH